MCIESINLTFILLDLCMKFKYAMQFVIFDVKEEPQSHHFPTQIVFEYHY